MQADSLPAEPERKPYLNVTKTINDELIANILLNSENQKAFHLRPGTRQGYTLRPLFMKNSFGSPNHGDQRREKMNVVWKRSTKLSLFADDMILYIENPQNAIRKLLELINEFGKVAGHNINTQKSLAFLYTNNKRQKQKFRKQSHLPLQPKE